MVLNRLQHRILTINFECVKVCNYIKFIHLLSFFFTETERIRHKIKFISES